MALTGQVDLLKAQLALTTNMAARRDLALRIFALEEKEEEAKQQAIIDANPAGSDAAINAQAQLDNLRATAPLRQQQVSRDNAGGPWAEQMQKMGANTPVTLESVNEEFQNIAVEGLDKFNQGLVEANGHIADLGQLARQTFVQMLVSLEQYLLKQAEIGIFGNGQGGGGGGGIFSMLMQSFGGGTSSGASLGSSIGSALETVPFAGGGKVVGPGTGKSDSMLAAVSNGEFWVNAEATRKWEPLLHAINEGRPVPIQRFAGGGRVGGSDVAAWLGGGRGDTYHFDMSINAPGADPAQLQRVADNQEQFARQEPRRMVEYFKAAGLVRKGR